MTNNPWMVEEQEPSANNGERSYWEVKKPTAPYPLYFIVVNMGDNTDGEHLASLLNEREKLIYSQMLRDRLFEDILNNVPEGDTPPTDVNEWKLWTIGQKIKQLIAKEKARG